MLTYKIDLESLHLLNDYRFFRASVERLKPETFPKLKKLAILTFLDLSLPGGYDQHRLLAGHYELLSLLPRLEELTLDRYLPSHLVPTLIAIGDRLRSLKLSSSPSMMLACSLSAKDLQKIQAGCPNLRLLDLQICNPSEEVR